MKITCASYKQVPTSSFGKICFFCIRKTKKKMSLKATLLIVFLIQFDCESINAFQHLEPTIRVANCSTEHGCLKAINYITHSWKPQVDPCEDFYEFACGRFGSNQHVLFPDDNNDENGDDYYDDQDDQDAIDFIETPEIHPDQQSVYSYTKRIERITRRFLQGRYKLKRNYLEAERTAIRFYQSCLRYGRYDQRDTQHSASFIRQVSRLVGDGGLKIFKGSSSSTPPLETMITSALQMSTHSGVFFNFHVERDMFNANENRLTLMPPSTFLFGDQTYFSELYK